MSQAKRSTSKRKPRRISSHHVFDDLGFPLSLIRIKRHEISGMHSHEFQELVVIVNGQGRHQTEDGQYPLRAGDIFVIAPGRAHCYSEAHELYLINILFDSSRLGLPLQDLKTLPGYHALFKVEPQLRKQDQFKSHLRLP